METYKKRIDECTDLESLFLIWKEAHHEEENFYETFPKKGRDTFPPKEFRDNWTNDGYLSEDTEDIQVLFVLKEPNESCALEPDESGVIKVEAFDNNKPFWIKDNVNSGKNLHRRMREITKELSDNEIMGDNWAKEVAVININKRGGYSKTNQNQLLKYIEKYKGFIRRQIAIINPKTIVFLCGNADENKVIINKLQPDVQKIFYCYHPSYRRLDDQTYLNKITKYEK